jgi:hypothetical protein
MKNILFILRKSQEQAFLTISIKKIAIRKNQSEGLFGYVMNLEKV